MKKICTLCCIALISAGVQAQSLETKTDSLMNYYRSEYGFNGVAFIEKGGDILLERGYGYRDFDKKTGNDVNTVFQMGSNTKQFTAEVILQLEKEGKLSVEDKITKHFPGYPNGDKITIQNLLTHTSGIYNYTDDTAWRDNATKALGKDALIALFRNKPLQFEPGSKFEYSNSNYILLGYIIEQVTGKKYETVIRERILIPCGMTHSGFDYTNLKNDDKATGYYSIQGDNYMQAPIADSTISFSAGALYSNVEDMYKWHKALLARKLLPDEWQAKAYKPFMDRYAYGWFVDTAFGKRLLGHSGGIPGFYTYEMRIEEDDVCILLLQNCLSPKMDNNTICINILKCIYSKNYKIPEPKKEVTVNSNVLSQYAGEYEVQPGFSITVTVKDNKLYAQGTDQPDFVLSASSDTRFFSKEVGAEIEFMKDTNGKVDKLVLSQGGQKIPAAKR